MMRKSVISSFLFCLFYLISISGSGQTDNFKSDIKHINKFLSQIPPDPSKRPYIYKDEPSLIKKINPVNLLIGGSLYVYQNVFSKHISADCLFTPSCSEFSKQSIKKYGLFKGILLSIDRLNRCNRIAAQDLKHKSVDQKTHRYPDPVSRYGKESQHNED
jgi:putative component of membrane protein insertase Oxa1/YidC/SpoIIIJ protein YidD